MEERQPCFLAIGDASARVGRDPQTIRRWANTGQVRRRQRGRIVEYHEDDLLAVAGLVELDAKDRDIARLRADLAQTRQDRDDALLLAKDRRDKVNAFQARAVSRYKAYEQRLAQAQTELATAAATIEDLTVRNTNGRRRMAEAEAQVVELTKQAQQCQARVQSYGQFYQRAHALLTEYALLVNAQQGWLTKQEHREHYERLVQDVAQLRVEGAAQGLHALPISRERGG